MNILILHDSLYGNTQKIAEAVNEVLVSHGHTKILNVKDATIADLKDLDLLVIGSPTQGGRGTPTLQAFLAQIPTGSLQNTKVTCFDTRFLEKDLNLPLRLLVKTIGYASPKMAKILQGKGGKLILSPEGFIVKGKKGPLAEGELNRAKEWGKQILIKAAPLSLKAPL